MRILLPFQPRWRSLVLEGTKTTTVRTKRYGSGGDEFELEGILFRLTRVDPLPLADARDRFWREEGMGSPEEFERTWIENHPTRGFRASDQVWVHGFERVT
jgi:hypothetical protein